ncbi:MAG: ABC transporter permease, partial [Hyphomicrobiales bacterium]
MTRLFKTRELWLGLGIIAVILLVTLRFPRFSQPGNLLTIFNDTSILMMLAMGQMAVILTRSIDLSMASNLALTGMIVAMANAAFPGVPIPLLIAGCIVVGAALGAFNGILVWKLDIPPIVV